MAKTRRAAPTRRRRAATFARRTASRIGGRAKRGLNTRAILNGAIGGAASRLASAYLPLPMGMGAPVGTLAAGVFLNDMTLQTVGGMQAGNAVVGMLPNATMPSGGLL